MSSSLSAFVCVCVFQIAQHFNAPWQQCAFYYPEDECDSCVALTFDDAPGQRHSLCDKVLDLLDEYNVSLLPPTFPSLSPD